MIMIKFNSIILILISFIFYSAISFAANYDCSDSETLCVPSEFSDIQAAVDVVRAGQTVLVANGTYRGFRVTTSGTSTQQITIKAEEDVLINQPNPYPGNGISLHNVNYVTIDGFTVDGNSFNPDRIYNYDYAGIAARRASPDNPMRGIKILNNTVKNAIPANLELGNLSHSLIEGNISYNAQAALRSGGAFAGIGLYLANSGSDNTIIRNNHFYNNASYGIHINGDQHVSGGDGLVTGLLIEGNILKNNGKNGISMDGVQESIIQNNLFIGNGKHSIRGFRIDASEGSKNLVIVNNTMVGNESALKISEDLGGHIIFNNIMVDNDNGIMLDSSNYTGSSNMVNSANPSDLFVDHNRGDYRLRLGSQAIDTGRSTFSGESAPTLDLSGGIRPQGGGYDLGAFEYGSDSSRRVNPPTGLKLLP